MPRTSSKALRQQVAGDERPIGAAGAMVVHRRVVDGQRIQRNAPTGPRRRGRCAGQGRFFLPSARAVGVPAMPP